MAVVRPMQHPVTSVAPTIVSSPTSPLNLPPINVTLPPSKRSFISNIFIFISSNLDKLTTTSTTTTTTTNPTQQIRAATAFLSSQGVTSAQTQQIRQLITNANNLSQQNNPQRLTDVGQRSTSNVKYSNFILRSKLIFFLSSLDSTNYCRSYSSTLRPGAQCSYCHLQIRS